MIEEAIGERREWLATTGVDADDRFNAVRKLRVTVTISKPQLDLSTAGSENCKKDFKSLSLKGGLHPERILELKHTESKQQEQVEKVLQDLFQFDTQGAVGKKRMNVIIGKCRGSKLALAQAYSFFSSNRFSALRLHTTPKPGQCPVLYTAFPLRVPGLFYLLSIIFRFF